MLGLTSTSILPSDYISFFWGIALGIIGAFSAGFLKKAGEDSFSWIRNKISPKPPEQQSTQVVVHVAGNHISTVAGEHPPAELKPVVTKRVSRVTFDEIQSAINKAPPLQRDHVAKSYVGIRVEWDTYYKSASRRDNDMVSVRLTTNPQLGLTTVTCEVPFNDYRELGVLEEGAKIRVVGEIVEAGSWDITLKDVRLYIHGK